MSKVNKISDQTKKLCGMAMFAALAFVLSLLTSGVRIAFLTIDIKDAILAIGAFIYGPLAALPICIVTAFLSSVITGFETGFWGLAMDFLSSLVFSMTAALVYKYKRTFSGAIIAAICSVISVVIVMGFANIFITPFYMGVKSADVIAMLPTVLLPFNLSKGLMNAAVMLLIYKPLTNILRKTRLLPPAEKKYGYDKKSLWLVIISLVVLILTAVFLLVVMKGKFVLFGV